MPLKFTKEMSTHLFKYVRKVEVSFNALDARSTSVRELFRQIQADRFKTANPKLDIKAKLHDSAAAPVAKFHFVDGTEKEFEGHNYDCSEILYSVHVKAMQLDTDYELEGKNIDDLV